MGIGPEWVGVIGTVVGGVLGVAGTVASRWGERGERRRERREDFDREDHLRDIALRRTLYGGCIEAAAEAIRAISMYAFEVDHPELVWDSQERLDRAITKMSALRPELDLSAPASVRTPFHDLYELVFTLKLAQHRDPADDDPDQGKAGALQTSLLDAMRADLRISEAS